MKVMMMIDFNQTEVVSLSSLVKYFALQREREPRLFSINAVIQLELEWRN